MPKLRQGDIFSTADREDFELAIVFGHIGFNQLSITWQQFSEHIPALVGERDPFKHMKSPVQYRPGRWMWFIPSELNHGMSTTRLSEELGVALDWANRQGIKQIFTNGIADTDHVRDTQSNRMSDEKRAAALLALTTRYEIQMSLSITLMSLNNIFVRERQQT
jgi:hypothetical protein